ncbi:hypothetical protein [Thermococcus sp. Bubb.Bath]|uniref:hypothetical protein n=1 Tax=Thermococcus sp. Bubb.Bath TaxID=1638242 RepID=UPI00143B1330|nr:hypothetical protein [Thermococcus sp. Bubb.Bath]NJF24970.1 hypothetical protein [Thermococcus sp. Bubb.Bath]
MNVRMVYILGFLLLFLGSVLTATYSPASCGGLACMLPSSIVFDANLNSTPELASSGGGFVFTSDYSLDISKFAVVLNSSTGASFNIKNGTLVIETGSLRNLTIIYHNGTLEIRGEEREKKSANLQRLVFRKGLEVNSLTVYGDPREYLDFEYCSEHFDELKKECEGSGSPDYQLYSGFVLMVSGLTLFGLGLLRGSS